MLNEKPPSTEPNSSDTIQKVKKYWNRLGPGLTTGAADDDPSGIATYSQTGAQYGFKFLWLSLWSLPLMAVVQEMCARIGMVTGRGLAANIRLRYPRWVLTFCVVLLFIANTFNMGADIGAMAKAVELLLPSVPFYIAVIFFALMSLYLQIFTSYKTYAGYLKYLTLILFSYVITGLLIDLDWSLVFSNLFIPSFEFTKDQAILICAILGTTISPYLFFWQTSQEVEEETLNGKDMSTERVAVSSEEIKDMRVDVWSGMAVSNIVMFFVIVVCAGTLYSNGITNITSAADAAEALKPLAGHFAYLLFSLGIIGTGLLALPVLAGSSAYAISEAFKWKEGLNNKFEEAYAFYGVIILSMIVALVFNFIGIDPIRVLIYSAVANGIISPVMLFFIVRLSSNKQVMGERVNHPIITAMGWLTVLVMSLAGLAVIYSLL